MRGVRRAGRDSAIAVDARNNSTEQLNAKSNSVGRINKQAYKEVAVLDSRVEVIDREIKQMKLTLEEIKHTLQLRMFLKPDVVDR